MSDDVIRRVFKGLVVAYGLLGLMMAVVLYSI